MKVISKLILLSILALGSLDGHPRPESEVAWVRTVEELDQLDPKSKSLALDVRRVGEWKLVEAAVRKFPHMEKLQLYHFAHEVHPSVFANLGKLGKLHSLELSGDARLRREDFALLGKMTSLKKLSLSLPCTWLSDARIALLRTLAELERLNLGEGWEEAEARIEQAVRGAAR